MKYIKLFEGFYDDDDLIRIKTEFSTQLKELRNQFELDVKDIFHQFEDDFSQECIIKNFTEGEINSSAGGGIGKFLSTLDGI